MEADCGTGWDGPHGSDDLGGETDRVEAAQVQLEGHLSEENMARSPDPDVPFMDALDIYAAAPQQLMQRQQNWTSSPTFTRCWMEKCTKQFMLNCLY